MFMEKFEFSKNTLSKLLCLLNVFGRDSIKNELSLKATVLNTALFFIFLFILAFGIIGEDKFVFSQLIISTFYPEYNNLQFHKIFYYFPIGIFALLANMFFSFITTVVFSVYLFVDRNLYYKNFSLVLKIFCQASKCFSLCGLIIISILPVLFVKGLLFYNTLNFNIEIYEMISYVCIFTGAILILGLIRPISKLRNLRHTHTNQSFNFFDKMDKSFPTSLILMQAILGFLFFCSLDALLKILLPFTPPLINKTELLNLHCNYLITSSSTPPALKAAYKQAGCSRVISCFEMPDNSTKTACLNQIFLSSNDFYNLAKFGEKDYCKEINT